MLSEKDFFEWYSTAAPADLALMEKVEGFGYLFDDMCFRKGSITYRSVAFWDENGIILGRDELPEEIETFNYSMFRYKAQEQDDCLGYFDHSNSLLCVPKNAEDATIIHEMIHLHEDVYSDLPLFYRDIVLWALYTDLKDRIFKDGKPGLDGILTNHAHIINCGSVYENGGDHNLLFLLKSFDLDIKMGFQLGTVFGYGRENKFQGYFYTKSE